MSQAKVTAQKKGRKVLQVKRNTHFVQPDRTSSWQEDSLIELRHLQETLKVVEAVFIVLRPVSPHIEHLAILSQMAIPSKRFVEEVSMKTETLW